MLREGVIYIFENVEAQRIKVGLTVNPADVRNGMGRLKDCNDIWTRKSGMCQMCGTRALVDAQGRMPNHVTCNGSTFLPIESDQTLAQDYLGYLKEENKTLKGSEKGSCTRKIKTLETRINKYKSMPKPIGTFVLKAFYYVNEVESIEKVAHKEIEEYLDEDAPLGEIFTCSVEKACEVLDSILSYNKNFIGKELF